MGEPGTREESDGGDAKNLRMGGFLAAGWWEIIGEIGERIMTIRN
jgi:hypothetical protein